MKKDSDYKQWLTDLKSRIRQSQIKAAVKVNTELLRLYWDLGKDIVARQMEAAWGEGFFEQLSQDLLKEFPDMKGFSTSNLYYIRQFYQFYTKGKSIRQQAVGEIPHQLGAELQPVCNQGDRILHQVGGELEDHPIFQIPWRHHVQIFTKAKSIKEALFYVQKTIENGWSRAVLMNFMEAGLYAAQGKALTNFKRLLPEPQSDLANQMLKDPYNFDFLTLTEPYKEKELEDALVSNITQLLLELGQGFAYVGRQVPVKIGDKERFIDLLFYHLELRCFVVIELKATEFEPEYVGKLGVYVAAINHQRKKPTDNPTIGMIICKTKNHVEVKYSLEAVNHPIGVSDYQLAQLLPDDLKSSLPSIEELEEELGKMSND